MDLSESQYRAIIEKFIAELEIKMSNDLDLLQKQVEQNKSFIFDASIKRITTVTKKAQNAKAECLELLQRSVDTKREEVLNEIESESIDKQRQPVGYEQLRRLDMNVYSTVGLKNPGQGCDTINDRDKYIKDIKDAKPNQPIKRTLYMGLGNKH